ncbi:unnamed protein product [Schistosoma margrebowiei]|uniref:Uncharacterized protein n=1 Tax=Schistosoma margrebowiei TaxID=48269 RepID=A0A183MMW1_9TREM|nr:unnamed protein product [Schistosoma margrebowiei]
MTLSNFSNVDYICIAQGDDNSILSNEEFNKIFILSTH